MPTRSVHEIDIDDSRFREFAQLFEKYQAAVKALPGDWGKVGTAASGVKSGFVEMTSALAAQAELLHKSTLETIRLSTAAGATQRSFSALSRDTGSIAKNITEATRSFLTWVGAVGVIGGLLGAGGGLFGIERLAGSASSQRRSAQGLVGASVGQESAFNVNFNRTIDAGSLVNNVNDAMTDASKRWMLTSLGLTESQIAGKSAPDVAAELIPLLKRRADQTQTGLLQNDPILGPLLGRDAIRLKQTSVGEVNQEIAGYRRDSEQLNLTDKTTRAWQDLSVQLDRAGRKIENVLIDGLSGLATPLDKLSDSFIHIVDVFAHSDTLKTWVDAAGDGLERFAKYIDDPAFQKDIQNFVTGVGELSRAIVAAINWISSDATASKAGLVGGAFAGGAVGGAVAGLPGALVGGAVGATVGAQATINARLSNQGFVVSPDGVTMLPPREKEWYAPIPPAAGKAGADSWWSNVTGWLRAHSGGGEASTGDASEFERAFRAIYQIESGSGRRYNNAPYRGHAATGPMQIIPSTFRANSEPGEELTNPEDNIRVGRRLIQRLWDKYHDWAKVAYSYANGSPGALDQNPGYVNEFTRLMRNSQPQLQQPQQHSATALPPGWSIQNGRLKPPADYAKKYLVPKGTAAGDPGAGRQISLAEAAAMNASDPDKGKHLPVMSSDYVFGKGRVVAPGSGVTVQIQLDNRTGASPTIIANQIAQ